MNVSFDLVEENKRRLIIDKISRWAVRIGGISIFAALLFIFVFFIGELEPLFRGAPHQPTTSSQSIEQPLPVEGWISNQEEVVFAKLATGKVVPFSESVTTPLPLLNANLQFINRGINQVFVTKPNENRFQFILPLQNKNEWQFIPLFDEVLPSELTHANQFQFIANHSGWTIAAKFAGKLHLLKKNENGMQHHIAPILESSEFTLSTSGNEFLVYQEDNLTLYRLNGESIEPWASFEGIASEIINVKFIPHSPSFVTQNKLGTLSYWNLASQERGFELQKAMSLPIPIQPNAWQLLPDTRFVSGVDMQGRLVEWHLTTQSKYIYDNVFDFSPTYSQLTTDSQLLFWDHQRLAQLDISDVGKTLSFKALFFPIQYDGYEKPEYIWQTTSIGHNVEPKFSVVPLVFGTFKAAFYAMLVAIPIALGGAIYTAYFMSSRLRAWVKPMIELMEALPTVIIGFLAAVWLTPVVDVYLVQIMTFIAILPSLVLLASLIWSTLPRKVTKVLPSGWHLFSIFPVILLSIVLSQTLGPMIEGRLFQGDIQTYLALQGIDYQQRNSIIVGLAMGFAVIPTIYTLAEEAIYAVPKHLSQGAFALGATKWQALRHAVLLTASPGIVSAIMMGLGRAVGETMIVLMATGNTPLTDWNILEGMRSLASTIAIEMPESDVGSHHYNTLMLSAFILFVFTFVFNSLAEMIRQQLREKYRSL